MLNVADIRRAFKHEARIVGGKATTVELLGASFLADEDAIFGSVNAKYVEQELAWYLTQKCSLTDFPAPIPSIWVKCANSASEVNSNYGWCFYSVENGNQKQHILSELHKDPSSRRAIAIYTRPSMHTDAVANGKQDFLCTNAVTYFIRDAKLTCVVQMRSSDAVLGYRNDLAWQKRVLRELATELNVTPGSIVWQAASLHIYERHFHYLEH